MSQRGPKGTYELVLLPGDGIGVEVIADARALLEVVGPAIGVSFALDEIPCGGKFFLEHGSRDWPEGAEERCRAADAVLLGAVGWNGPDGAPVSMLRSYRIVLSSRVYLAYLGLGSFSYAGLFAWLSGASFVLQNLYGLTPFVFGVVFAIGAVGYMVGTTIAARVVARLGLDRVAGLGSAMLAIGGLLMSLSVALGFTSSLSLVLPVAMFLAGLGMVLPQSIAGAMTPFPERAGAASSLFGFVQQTAAAVCGALVAWLLGRNAWPLAAAMALMGCATLLLWLLTRGVRRAVAKF